MDEIPFIGEDIKKKMKKFLEEGKKSKLLIFEPDPKQETLDAFTQIWGVGDVAAEKLYASGILSID